MRRLLLTVSILFTAVTASAADSAPATGTDCVINPRSTIEIGSHEGGVLAEVVVSRGDSVRKGEVIAKLDSEVERLTAELARLRAESDVEVRSGVAQSEYRLNEMVRLKKPLMDKTIAPSVYDQAEIEHQLAVLGLEAARMDSKVAKVDHQRSLASLGRREIRSPVDGIVVDVAMFPGEYVHEQTPLMTIAEINPLNVEVFLPVARYGTVKRGMSARIMPEEPVGGVYSADITVVDSVFDAASRTFGVRLELPNPQHELPGGLRCTIEFGELRAAGNDR